MLLRIGVGIMSESTLLDRYKAALLNQKTISILVLVSGSIVGVKQFVSSISELIDEFKSGPVIEVISTELVDDDEYFTNYEITLRNATSKPQIVTAASIHINVVTTVPQCVGRPVSALVSTSTTDVHLKKSDVGRRIEVRLSQLIPPNGVDKFTLRLNAEMEAQIYDATTFLSITDIPRPLWIGRMALFFPSDHERTLERETVNFNSPKYSRDAKCTLSAIKEIIAHRAANAKNERLINLISRSERVLANFNIDENSIAYALAFASEDGKPVIKPFEQPQAEGPLKVFKDEIRDQWLIDRIVCRYREGSFKIQQDQTRCMGRMNEFERAEWWSMIFPMDPPLGKPHDAE